MKFSQLTKPKLDKIIKYANFTSDEEQILVLLSKDKNSEQICQQLLISKATLSRRIKNIKYKIKEISGEMISDKIPIWEKVTLTIEEAAEYSNIGINRICKMANEPGCPFVLYVGKGKKLIKRKEFEKFIDKTSGI